MFFLSYKIRSAKDPESETFYTKTTKILGYYFLTLK